MSWKLSHHVELRKTVAITKVNPCRQQPLSFSESKIHDCHISNLRRTFTFSFEDPIFKETETLYLDAEYCETQGNFQPFKEAFTPLTRPHQGHYIGMIKFKK